jgi:hypothetical protein
MCSGAYEKTINLLITKHLTPSPGLGHQAASMTILGVHTYLITLGVKGHDIGIPGV